MTDFHFKPAERQPFAEIDLTPEQKKKLENVTAWAVFHQPFFAHLILAELPIRAVADVPIAATDSFNIFINPETFFAYTLGEQAFILFHEVMHTVFGDPALMQSWHKRGSIRLGGAELKFDANLLNIAMDYIINAQLIAASTTERRIGHFNTDWLYDEKISEKGVEAMLDIYVDLLKKPRKHKKRFDLVLSPNDTKSGEEERKPRDPEEWKSAVASAAQAADMQGKLPDSFKRLIGEILEPKVSWQDHLRATMLRVNGSEGLDWAQPDRRSISRDIIGYEPIFFGRPSGFGAGTVVVAVDTSGSISDAVIGVFFGEMRGILEDINPAELIVMWCDAKVQRVDICEELEDLIELKSKGAPGGGGTSFIPVFKEVERMGLEPDMLVYLTDLYGSFPQEEPNYPVVWGSISKGEKVPFGELVKIEL